MRTAHLHERREIELRAQPAVGAQADEHPVEVDDGQAFGAPKAENDVTPRPVDVHLQRAPIHPGWVVGRHQGRLARERHLHVGVDR